MRKRPERHPKLLLFETVAPPVKIFHPIFDTSSLVTTQSSCQLRILSNRKNLCISYISEIYADETSYASELRDKLSRALGVSWSKEDNPDRTSANGLYVVFLAYKRIPILILEFKWEYSEGSSDASTHVGLSMKQSWIQKDMSFLRL